MRGKVAVNSFNYYAGRITPAYAGKSKLNHALGKDG